MRFTTSIVDSSRTTFANPATWYSDNINLGAGNSVRLSFHIWWKDISLTFFLLRSNFYSVVPFSGGAVQEPWDDYTAAYRVVDPAWVDPVKGDAEQHHIVSMMNIGAQYVVIGWSASDYTGIDPVIKISMSIEERHIS